MQFRNQADTICALSTPSGVGALGVIRVSGMDALEIVSKIFSKNLVKAEGYSLHFGKIKDGDEIVDEVLLSVFRAPRSFTGEDVVEISCHGSPFILSSVLKLLVEKGCRMAEPGEYSMRAFSHGKMDLSQAEAVADLIASSSKAAHKLAMNQMRGKFSDQINKLREDLIHFASLVELELDFSEEDVEFADRDELRDLVNKIKIIVADLMNSFATGNAIKNGVPIAILGAPNMGKSTLLNALLNEDRAIVSAIAGTTRDTIEDETVLDGVRFRFIDTAGIRETTDEIETIGISRAMETAKKATVVLYLFDISTDNIGEVKSQIEKLRKEIGDEAQVLAVGNKKDLAQNPEEAQNAFSDIKPFLALSAETGEGLEELKKFLVEASHALDVEGKEVVVTNIRHYEALKKTNEALDAVLHGLKSAITGDFLAIDIRRALHHLGEITGEITTDDLLGNIFSKFCIGK